MRDICIILFMSNVALCSCNLTSGTNDREVTPWGETINSDGAPYEEEGDSIDVSAHFSLKDIIEAGELIMLTVSGPETYYDYHGHGMGLHYLLCEKFAQKMGVSLRVEVCKDSVEMMKRLKVGEGDIAAFPVQADSIGKDSSDGAFLSCGVKDSLQHSWMVNSDSKELAQELNSWFDARMLEQTRQEMKSVMTNGFVKRHIYPFMLSRKEAVISTYDALFRKYAPVAQCDWTLIAAQCYQESCFDPKAKSWAGACGLMQIMPATADHLGLPRANIYSPEPNISAACRYMAELQGKFNDIRNRQERLRFALASYNGGYNHIRDAMQLAKKYGKNPERWEDVKQFVLALQEAKYYRDPVVKYGYMRGSETADYVDRIIERWNEYRHATRSKYSSGVNAVPSPSKKKNKWDK